ncbi:HvfC family RiPP maturation protein [Litoribrevibacter albus]|uniref:DUF2063 domain-containing protein n=1 Tax=Litoribrevibacter albus TaxID=1473156 RepID=A0AA37S7Y7_9GAMM|nr:putative DNA-binding domain-containing protein [Litoribrevibacter albus]GLQ29643.1 DUF2063 domain-containing protein [Litoribrevibacter albus]
MHKVQNDAQTQTSLAQHQEAMTTYLRDPEQIAPPQQLDARRVGVYRDLVFNNVESQLSTSFPVIHSVLTEEHWYALVREFLRDYRAQTPYFSQLSAEFVDFLSHRTANPEEDDQVFHTPEFLLELAHYERVELDLFMLDREPSSLFQQDTEENLLTRVITLCNVALPLVYQYPVHQISPDFQPSEPPAQPTCLLLFQDDQEEVRFFELQLLAYHLVIKLAENQHSTGYDLLTELAESLQLPTTEQFYEQGAGLLKQLHALNVLN